MKAIKQVNSCSCVSLWCYRHNAHPTPPFPPGKHIDTKHPNSPCIVQRKWVVALAGIGSLHAGRQRGLKVYENEKIIIFAVEETDKNWSLVDIMMDLMCSVCAHRIWITCCHSHDFIFIYESFAWRMKIHSFHGADRAAHVMLSCTKHIDPAEKTIHTLSLTISHIIQLFLMCHYAFQFSEILR